MNADIIEYEKVLSINVCTLNYKRLLENIESDIENNRKSFIVAINPEKVIKAYKDIELKKLLNDSKYPIPDGIGIVYASKLRKGKIKQRITGIDSMEMICKLASDKSYRIFLYGAKKEVIEKSKEELEKKYENLIISGYIDGYEKDKKKIIEKINKSKPNILVVALGSPKQEDFIVNNMDKINCNIFQGVGGTFDVISGNVKRAPKWMQKYGLEWFYRLIKEPKRIFRQFNLVIFLFKVILNKKN